MAAGVHSRNACRQAAIVSSAREKTGRTRLSTATRRNGGTRKSFDSSAIIKQLYPDQETYKKEEQHRFEILDAHWDLPIKDVDLDAR